MIVYVSFICFAFIVGFYMGARFVAPTKFKPGATYEMTLRPGLWTGEWRKLDLPTSKRRQRIEVNK